MSMRTDETPTRAWAFVHPDFDEGPATGISTTGTGRVRMAEDDDAVRQSLLMLLSTRPGERVMRQSYGCPLHRLVFAPNDDTTAGLAIHYVRQAVARWEPRVEPLRIDAEADPDDPDKLVVRLDYRVRSGGRRHQLAMTVDLAGG